MRKSILIFVFLSSPFLSYSWSPAESASLGNETQGIQFKELVPNLHLEMVVSEQKLISESTSVSFLITLVDLSDAIVLPVRREEEVFTFGRRTSPRLHLWIKVFRN